MVRRALGVKAIEAPGVRRRVTARDARFALDLAHDQREHSVGKRRMANDPLPVAQRALRSPGYARREGEGGKAKA
jgi:hypothetical protein